MDVLLANPRGFCAGVDRAIAIVEQAIAQFGAPIYVRHEVVHNRFDVDRMHVRDADQLAYVTQTTLSVDDAAAIVSALKARFPAIVGPKRDDICYATQNRQDAVKALVPEVDAVIVVGSPNSSNSNRLREVAAHRGVPAWMIDRAEQLRPEGVAGRRRGGVTAGPSGPEVLRQQVLGRLQ